MYKYVGIKLIEAEPAYKVVGACQQVLIVPAAEVKDDELPQCAQDGYKVRYADGYESWSPKAAFEEAYRDVGKLTFPMALAMLQKGARIARHSWDLVLASGDWMTQKYIFLEQGYPNGVPASEQLHNACGIPEGETVFHDPYIHACDIDTNHLSIYTPTVNDLFATDWYIVHWGNYPFKD